MDLREYHIKSIRDKRGFVDLKETPTPLPIKRRTGESSLLILLSMDT